MFSVIYAIQKICSSLILKQDNPFVEWERIEEINLQDQEVLNLNSRDMGRRQNALLGAI